MIHYTPLQLKLNSKSLISGTMTLPYQSPVEIFSRLQRHYRYKFIFESKDISPNAGRFSLIGIDPVLQVTGKKNSFSLHQLQSRGEAYLQSLTAQDLQLCQIVRRTRTSITGTIVQQTVAGEETQRSKQPNIAQIIRLLLLKFKLSESSLLGLYGAFSYDFVRLFEDLPERLPDTNVPDFNLFLYDTFVFFDHLKQRAELVVIRLQRQLVQQAIQQLASYIQAKPTPLPHYAVTQAHFTHTTAAYERSVRIAQQAMRRGDVYEVVLANCLQAKFQGDPLGLYLQYRQANPSPYLFYFNFSNEQLVGASPEMMVRVEQNTVQLRPISGTRPRGADPIADYALMMDLLNDSKEKAELDMLIDLGRNDLSRICQPGIMVDDYRLVEKYSQVMHTVAHLSGKLAASYTAFDALIACLNAGTLTGAPKVAAMQLIDRLELQRRGYYGGSIGYLHFSGELNTGIIIRTAHIRGRKLSFQAGATILHRSVPASEYQETMHKAKAFLKVINFKQL